jgi:SAM-dependent methyltransferase
MIAVAKPEWFASWFDSEHYHRLYAHRDDREAGPFIDRLIARLRPAVGADVLDLGCGSGRHARRLASHGFRVTGLDLSTESLALARQRARADATSRASLRFVRQDMRQPFGDDAFDHVFSLFTSFGYFEDPSDHLTVVRNMAASLRPGGWLVLDYLSVRDAERRLLRSPEETIARDGVTYRITRWSDSDAIYKRIAIEGVEHVERVAKLTLEDFRFLFALNGLRVEEIYGDYQLSPFDAESSPRLILLARRSAGEVLPDAADRLGRHAQV